jgi:hypothetical protein
MKTLFVEALEVLGPGLSGWDEAAATLRGEKRYAPCEFAAGEPEMLAPNERRRATAAIRLALRVTEQLAKRSSLDLAALPSVFASSAGDLHVTDRVCVALGRPGIPVSPFHFHNIVHNASAGYWSIGAHACGGSTSLSAGETTFVAGLLEAGCLVLAERAPVLFVCYEQPAPAPIGAHLPIVAPFAAAMTIHRERAGPDCFAMHIEHVAKRDDTAMADDALERLRSGNAAARALPLLARFACRSDERVFLATAPEGARTSVAIHVEPA